LAGNVHKRPNGKWRARYRDPSHREHARHFERKVDADRWLAVMEVSISRGEWLDPADGKVRVGDWAAQWLAGQVQLKPSTFARYELILHKQVLPTWEKVPLSKVTFADVGVWVQELSASHLSAASVRQAHRVFSLLLDHAVHDGRLARNPAKGVRLPRVSPAHMVFLTHEQVDQLAVACAPYETLVRVLAYNGLSVGERRRHCASGGSTSNGAGCPSMRPLRRSVVRSSSEPQRRTSAASSPSLHS
jgi:integrase